MKENIDYEFIPEGDDNWHIRILNGNFTETVFQFGALSLNEDTESLSYNIELVSSADGDLSVDDVAFQEYTGKILYAILESATNNEIKHRTANT